MSFVPAQAWLEKMTAAVEIDDLTHLEQFEPTETIDYLAATEDCQRHFHRSPKILDHEEVEK